MTNKVVLFDLDGTLFDSGLDFEHIINKMFAARQRGKLDYSEFRKIISAGSEAMIKHAFQLTANDPKLPTLLTEFRKYYLQLMGEHAILFPGITELLDKLDQQHITWGIVTNRLERYIVPFLTKYALHKRPACIVGADTTSKRKPDPEPLLHATKLLNCKPENCYYVGDHMNDINAAKAAKIPCIAVSWGYHPSLAVLQALQPDFIVDTPAKILDIITDG